MCTLQTAIKSFEWGLDLCIGAAVKAGFTEISITPHLDNGAHRGGAADESELI